MGRWTYTRGLHDLGNHLYAYLQPDGGWGWSNAGLVIDGEASLLVDALYAGLTHQYVETPVKFEDGRSGMVAADLKIVDARVFPVLGKAA